MPPNETERAVAAEPSLRVLRLELELGWENAPYNQFTLPVLGTQDVTFVTFFPAPIEVDARVRMFSGDGTLDGYRSILSRALSADYDLIHAHTAHVGLFYLLFRRLLGGARVPRVFTVHNSYQNFKLRNKLLLLPVFAFYDRVACCGEASRKSFPALYRLLAGKRLRSVPNGVDTDRIDRILGDLPPDAAEPPVLQAVSVGRLIPIKNPFTLLTAFSRLAADVDGKLVIIGDGPLRGEMERFAAGLVEPGTRVSIEFAGRISRDSVFERLSSSHVYLATSYGEGLPVAVLEAMACGCPVILSDIEPHREIAEGAQCIPLVAPDDLEGWISEIRRFASLSPEERLSRGSQCRSIVEDRFSLPSMLAGYRTLYQEVVSGR